MREDHYDADYLMSFTTGGLFLNESIAVADLHTMGSDWDETARKACAAKTFPIRKDASALRIIREITKRLRQLEPTELVLLCNGTRDEQAAVLWLAVCRTYSFIAEFSSELLVERYEASRSHITYSDFDTFYERKAEWSAKLAGIAPSTRAKLRAVLFRLMREAGILDVGDRLHGNLIPSQVAALMTQNDPRELRYFPSASRRQDTRPS